MLGNAHFAYVQARLLARHGDRPTDATWRMLGASKSLGHFLESARQTGLEPWVAHLSASSDIHAIEAELRRDWRALTKKVSMWMPPKWRAAVAWTGELADLPFQDADIGENALVEWTARFRALWPDGDKRDRRDLDAMLDAFANDKDDDARSHLRARLKRVLRQAAQRPPAAFAFLGLMALDLLQLREGLVRRSLFPELVEG